MKTLIWKNPKELREEKRKYKEPKGYILVEVERIEEKKKTTKREGYSKKIFLIQSVPLSSDKNMQRFSFELGGVLN